MTYRNEFWENGNLLFTTKSEQTSIWNALAEARGTALVFADATQGKITPNQIEIRCYKESPIFREELASGVSVHANVPDRVVH